MTHECFNIINIIDKRIPFDEKDGSILRSLLVSISQIIRQKHCEHVLLKMAGNDCKYCFDVCLLIFYKLAKKVQVGKDQEKAQSEKDSHSKNRGGKKPN